MLSYLEFGTNRPAVQCGCKHRSIRIPWFRNVVLHRSRLVGYTWKVVARDIQRVAALLHRKCIRHRSNPSRLTLITIPGFDPFDVYGCLRKNFRVNWLSSMLSLTIQSAGAYSFSISMGPYACAYALASKNDLTAIVPIGALSSNE